MPGFRRAVAEETDSDSEASTIMEEKEPETDDQRAANMAAIALVWSDTTQFVSC